MKNRRRSWRNFNANAAKLGIVREPLNIQVMEDIDGKTHYDGLIDPGMVVISKNARETWLNLLNNTKNSMIDNFRSIKWLFHEIEELKGRKSQDGNQIVGRDQGPNEEDRSQDGCHQLFNFQEHRTDQEDRITKVE